MTSPLPANEAERLEALRSYEVLDSGSESSFDDIVELASLVCGTPIAMVSLVDESRQWFKAKVGLTQSETPREQAFCAHTILSDETLVVPDATSDERFASNPMVLDDPRFRFYAGAPLSDSAGLNLGALCVIDTTPRPEALDETQMKALRALSRQVVRLLELHRVSASLARALAHVEALAPLLPMCAWCKNVRNDRAYWTSVEEYLSSELGISTTHGMCPECVKTL